MIRQLHTPTGIIEVDSATVTDAELAALNVTWVDLFPLVAVPHWARIDNFQPAENKPLIVRRNYEGKEFVIPCYVSQALVNEYQGGQLAIGDFVIVEFVDGDLDKPLAIAKVFKSW